jgi:hypothetical protein
MELELIRKTRSNNSTIGELSINGNFECYVLEDKDRGLKKDMTLSELVSKKIHGQTAIPEGRYEIAITFSNRFKKMLPLLLDVPAFAGIRIHAGNSAADTEGCLLPGKNKSADSVSSSRIAFTSLYDKLKVAVEGEKVFITIK